jgi:hypothetical protein
MTQGSPLRFARFGERPQCDAAFRGSRNDTLTRCLSADNCRNQAISVRRDSAAKLVDGLASESPASADYPVGTVVISGDMDSNETSCPSLLR